MRTFLLLPPILLQEVIFLNLGSAVSGVRLGH